MFGKYLYKQQKQIVYWKSLLVGKLSGILKKYKALPRKKKSNLRFFPAASSVDARSKTA